MAASRGGLATFSKVGCENWQEKEITRNSVDSATECGKLCADTDGCALFNFQPDSQDANCIQPNTCILFAEGCFPTEDPCWDLYPSPKNKCLGGRTTSVLNGQHLEDYLLLNSFFCNMTDRKYLEIGAFDGVRFSNTKFFEDAMNWSGILIEGAPTQGELLSKSRGGNPRNHIFREAACSKKGTLTMAGDGAPMAGTLDEMSDTEKETWGLEQAKKVEVPCEPLSSMLKTANASKLALFILDVEGAELLVLKTMDWNVEVCVWVVEMDGLNPEKDQGVEDLLAKHNYSRSDAQFWQSEKDQGYHGGGQNVAYVHHDLKNCLKD